MSQTLTAEQRAELADMDAAAEGFSETLQAWAETYPEAAKNLGEWMRTAVGTRETGGCGLKRAGRLIRDLL